jgi:hydroxymethylbilane synthase
VRRLRIGTRGSRLALWQASWVARRLAALPFVGETEIVVLKSAGDREPERPLHEIGGSGLFVKELEDALLRDEVDLAVHSLKDMATDVPAGLRLVAVAERGPVEDCLVAPGPATLATLPRGATVATGSPRRRALLLDARPDLCVVPLRGNVPTRIEKVAAGAAAATVLARAGLERLGLGGHVREVLDADRFPPAPGQGAVAVE